MHDFASAVPKMAIRGSRLSTTQIAELAELSLQLEIETWPKPGLVSHIDSGSHSDMDASTFYRSARALHPFFGELAEAGERGDHMHTLRTIGLRAERAMLEATGGVNTHRGAIFGLGLLCAAAGVAESGRIDRPVPLGVIVSRRWGRDIVGGPRLSESHGEVARRRFGAGGARWEAARGFPSIITSDYLQCIMRIHVSQTTRKLHGYRPASPLSHRSRIRTYFIAAECSGCALPGRPRSRFWTKAVSHAATGEAEPRSFILPSSNAA
jgi:ATP:dephospho-CoA triphosphoribosyl transferase